jgi:hypothetical protein
MLKASFALQCLKGDGVLSVCCLLYEWHIINCESFQRKKHSFLLLKIWQISKTKKLLSIFHLTKAVVEVVVVFLGFRNETNFGFSALGSI